MLLILKVLNNKTNYVQSRMNTSQELVLQQLLEGKILTVEEESKANQQVQTFSNLQQAKAMSNHMI